MTDCTTVIQQSQTRPRFDDFHQMDDMRITSYSMRYYLNTPGINCPTTFPVQPTTRIQLSGDSWKTGKWRTDVESDLKGINRLNSRTKCDDLLYNKETNIFDNTPTESAPDGDFPLTFNRLFNPPTTLRATGWNRWDHLHHDPQETFEQPFDFFIPSRWNDRERFACNKNNNKAGLPPMYNPITSRELSPAMPTA